jgi:hypothetical protein
VQGEMHTVDFLLGHTASVLTVELWFIGIWLLPTIAVGSAETFRVVRRTYIRLFTLCLPTPPGSCTFAEALRQLSVTMVGIQRAGLGSLISHCLSVGLLSTMLGGHQAQHQCVVRFLFFHTHGH